MIDAKHIGMDVHRESRVMRRSIVRSGVFRICRYQVQIRIRIRFTTCGSSRFNDKTVAVCYISTRL